MLILSPTMPITINTIEPILNVLIGSLNQMMPMLAISAVPARGIVQKFLLGSAGMMAQRSNAPATNISKPCALAPSRRA